MVVRVGSTSDMKLLMNNIGITGAVRVIRVFTSEKVVRLLYVLALFRIWLLCN